ncbi:unnamed protein product [Diabrotica balteata]|uniref:Ionotropic receptor n=1 Tax=Diabrotica balteata TaxID=107213 RepID=A0A9N9XG64_DIABA|nr:unnamed protein product [Diabrotica balteata]
MRVVTFVILLSALQVNMLNISLLKDDHLSYCLKRIARDVDYHMHIFIKSTNVTLSLVPTFSKIAIESNNLNVLDTFSSTPNLFTITYGSLVELNDTLFDLSAKTVFRTILSHFIVLTTKHEELLQISKLLWKYRFYKSLILLQNDVIVELYVIDYKNSNCGKIIKYKKINSCKNKKFKRKVKPIKPNVKKSFSQCSLTVGVSFTPPMILNISDSYPGIVTELLRVISASSSFNFQFNQDDCYLDQLREFRFDAMYEHFDIGKIDLAFTLNLHLTHKVFFCVHNVGFYMFFCLLELTYRQAKMTSFSPLALYEKRIRNMDDLINSNIPVKMYASNTLSFPKDSPLLKKTEVFPDSKTDLDNVVVAASREGFATMWGKIGFINRPFLSETMDYFNVEPYQYGFYIPDNNIFYEEFVISIRRVIECGFLEALYRKYKTFFMFKYKHAYLSHDTSVKRDLNSCMFMFIVLFAGYCISLVVFGIEMLVAREYSPLTTLKISGKRFIDSFRRKNKNDGMPDPNKI